METYQLDQPVPSSEEEQLGSIKQEPIAHWHEGDIHHSFTWAFFSFLFILIWDSKPYVTPHVGRLPLLWLVRAMQSK